MMWLKPEGTEFSHAIDYQPKHPARWCKLHYFATAIRNLNFYGPYGRLWSFEGHDWICYIRFRLYSMGWKYAVRHPLSLWEHYHRDFRDILAMAKIVNGADDPYIEATYEVMVHTAEGQITPYAQREIGQ